MRKLAATLAAATIFFAPNANAAGIGDSAGQPLEVDSSWVTQNAIWWFGQPNPNPPEQTVVWALTSSQQSPPGLELRLPQPGGAF